MYNIIAQKESKLNLQMAADQRRLAHASKRDSTSMKTISLLGAIFLPATLLASIFSMVFFGDDDLSKTVSLMFLSPAMYNANGKKKRKKNLTGADICGLQKDSR